MSLSRAAALIEEMTPFIRERAWDLLETTYHEIAARHSGRALAGSIAAVDLVGYQKVIAAGLKKALARARKTHARTVYFEYDLDNGWNSEFFICPDYRPEADGDDDWASDYDEHLPGPGQSELGRIYRENPGFASPDETMGTTIYLIARTVTAFGRAADGIADQRIVICMGFHDQDPIVRIREP